MSVRSLGSFLILHLSFAGCSSAGDDGPAPVSQGGSSGGQAGAGVAGGGASTGGANSSGGKASGGDAGTGGTSASGGTSAAGGRSGSGGSAGAPGGTAGTGGSQDGGRGGSGGGLPGEYGFTYRIPGSQPFVCRDQPVELPDADWLCTFSQGDSPAYVYVQATAVDVMCVLSATGIYQVDLAQISIDGVVTPLSNAAYDWGGGHHNDSLSFDHEGKTYKYYHSSFGFGFRQCEPMDCLDVFEPGVTTPEIEGCGADRSLPEVCVPIDEQGTHEPLVDEFMKCLGDTE